MLGIVPLALLNFPRVPAKFFRLVGKNTIRQEEGIRELRINQYALGFIITHGMDFRALIGVGQIDEFGQGNVILYDAVIMEIANDVFRNPGIGETGRVRYDLGFGLLD